MLSVRLRLLVVLFLQFVFELPIPLVARPASNSNGDGMQSERDVRIGIVEGDVRLSRGNHERPDLKQPWEEAIKGEPLSQGFALASGNGRASIDFEDGSTVFLAENSLILFYRLSANKEGNLSTVTLVTGTATFELKPQEGNRFLIKTPTEELLLYSPLQFHSRVDAYLDATAITPRGEKGEVLTRKEFEPIRIQKGETFYLSAGHVVDLQIVSAMQRLSQIIETMCSNEKTPILTLQCQSLLRNSELLWKSAVLTAPQPTSTSHLGSSDFSSWDAWVSDRVQEKNSLMTAALMATGFSSPVPGLTELYQHGTFFQCAPYGTCWEPEESESGRQAAVPAVPQDRTTNSVPNQTFQPVTVRIYEPRYALCGLDQWTLVPHLADNPAELQRLQLLKAQAETERFRNALYFREGCFQHDYVFHQNRYVRLVNPRVICDPRHADCKKHPPFPHIKTVRINGRVGFVPHHPDDKKGKPPINLKNGILFPPEKPGQPIQRVPLQALEKPKFESRNTEELQREFAARPLTASAPEIRARLMVDTFRGSSVSSAFTNVSSHQITFDYKSQKFMMHTASVGEKNGKLSAVADLSGRRSSSFDRSNSNNSIGGFGRSNSSSERGSAYGGAGGGHYSSSASSGSHPSGSNSSSSSSSHSYSEPSSGRTSEPSSSSSSSSGGAHPH